MNSRADPSPASIVDRLLGRTAEISASLFAVRPPDQSGHRWPVLGLIVVMIVGAWLRFWGLATWGLAGDEKTMALPTLHILQFGTPHMPAGMLYPRAVAQLYMMAASASIFGLSEWAFRVPSVLCGIALIALAYPLGRRFLSPSWNFAFVVTVALLPALIADSQEARMYIFMVACLAGYTELVFRWESTGRTGYLLAAVLVMLLSLQFHVLSVFAGFLLLFPGLVRGDARKLWLGALALAFVGCCFALLNRWIDSCYPPRMHSGLARTEGASHLQLLRSGLGFAFALLEVALAAGIAWLTARKVPTRGIGLLVGCLVFAGLVAELGLHFHLGAVLLLIALVVAKRQGMRILPYALLIVLLTAVVAGAEFAWLHTLTGDPARKIIGALLGEPSFWSFLRAATYSPLAWSVVFLGLVYALWQVAQRRAVPDYWLFFVLAVWLPLFGLGFFSWYFEVRYTEFALLPVLLVTFALLQQVFSRATTRAAGAPLVLALIAAALIINPLELIHSVGPNPATHPDHKGAAAYIRSLHLAPNDILVAEDTLEQTYYLGHVDYWLHGRFDALQFVQSKHGELRDIYTDTPLIGTGDELQALIQRHDRGTIYVIGSGEDYIDDRRYMRSDGIYEVMQQPEFQQIFLGSDRTTRVWRIAPLPTRD
ncbi:MAG TPA: glycosyltransferase family 39 protein [Steroidobacteraceae bacterium]|nr:glycosyltransferase family 39 protein [Steroidobacteraceae bacterium]